MHAMVLYESQVPVKGEQCAALQYNAALKAAGAMQHPTNIHESADQRLKLPSERPPWPAGTLPGSQEACS
jgi:hypothetical protein